MSETCNGQGSGPGLREGQGRGDLDVPRFVVGCGDDEQDMGQTETGMRNEMYREEEMEGDLSPPERQIVVGICAMMKKSKSKPMTQILERLCMFDYISMVIFPEEVILEEPVEKWPLCDCLISFHSRGAAKHWYFCYLG